MITQLDRSRRWPKRRFAAIRSTTGAAWAAFEPPPDQIGVSGGVKFCRFVARLSLSARQQRCQKSDIAFGPCHCDLDVYANFSTCTWSAPQFARGTGIADDQRRGAAVRWMEAALSRELPMRLAMLLLLAEMMRVNVAAATKCGAAKVRSAPHTSASRTRMRSLDR